ncbi:AraC family transcriptional regulator [Nocardia sp. NEAU-G5]|uniref:AraC family transcriptional regulator n=1 Tax=Nocardia albiluteola TaxID=2842303 RepID=A0ABS6BDQ0_9NOCA|nr:AraC family transcriptional regulator [Nocardia albiluteola]MBU3067319.1 AraC family transcriptional regulator [Nocardia albiluteola]
MTLVRGTTLQGYPELVAERGGDPDALLAAVGIPRDVVGDYEQFAGGRNVLTALESAAALTATPDFGRRLARRRGVEIWGPLGAAIRTAPTVGDAIAALHRFLPVYCPAVTITVTQPAQHALPRLEYRFQPDRLPPHPQVIELTLSMALNMFRLIAGRTYAPVSVHLPHQPLTAESDYRQYFGCPVYFAEPFGGFLLRPGDLTRPLASDPAVRRVVEAYLTSITPPADGTSAGAVRTLIRQHLPTGTADRATVAAEIAVHPRTLQRRLAQEGTTFNDILDAVRRDEAERYLRRNELPLSRVAALLGYSEPSVFTRACHRWFGISGTDYRRTRRERP